MPIFQNFRSKIAAHNAGKSLRWPSNVLIFLHSLFTCKTLQACLDKYDLGNQQDSPFPKLHIELLEQFEGSRSFTNFFEPLLTKNRTEQPWYMYIPYRLGFSPQPQKNILVSHSRINPAPWKYIIYTNPAQGLLPDRLQNTPKIPVFQSCTPKINRYFSCAQSRRRAKNDIFARWYKVCTVYKYIYGPCRPYAYDGPGYLQVPHVRARKLVTFLLNHAGCVITSSGDSSFLWFFSSTHVCL
jgi:hypothetical protein